MIGKDVIQEVVKDPSVAEVLAIGRSKTGLTHPKLREIIHADLLNLDALKSEFKQIDACFGALGANPAANKANFSLVTKDYSLSTARALASANPNATFVLVSGAHSDSKSNMSWALRIKGETEQDLLSLPISSYVLRPSVVRSSHGNKSRTSVYRFMQTISDPFMPTLHKWFPKHFTTTRDIAAVFLHIIKHGHAKRILENTDINSLAEKLKTSHGSL